MNALVRSYGCGNCRLEALSEVLKLWRHSTSDHGNCVSNLHDFTGLMFEIEVKPLFKRRNTAHYIIHFLFPIFILKSPNPFRHRQNIRFASRPCVIQYLHPLVLANLERKRTLEGKDTWLVFNYSVYSGEVPVCSMSIVTTFLLDVSGARHVFKQPFSAK